MEIHPVRIEHGSVPNNTMPYPQRSSQNHRPGNHTSQNSVSAADLYKPSRSPVSAVSVAAAASVASAGGRYPAYPPTSAPSTQQLVPPPGLRYPPRLLPGNYHRDYRTNSRISLLHPEYSRPPVGQPGGRDVHQVHMHMDQQPPKKIRLQDHKDAAQPLRIDTREPPGTYNPQVEAISPTLPENIQEDQAFRTTKDELIQQIGKVDREIAKAESQIGILKKKQQELEEVALKPTVKSEVEEEALPKHQSLPQKIYAENRKKAASAHAKLDSLGPKVEWPLYNQPSDTSVYHENKRKNMHFKRKLLEYFKVIHSEEESRNTFLTETYSKLMQEWVRKCEKVEASTKRKAKEVKNREFFEKVFPELRKQREDKERFNRVGARVKSEADMEEIMDNLQEQAMEDKKMRSYAVIPPVILTPKEQKLTYHNNNGFVEDMEATYKIRQYINMWTPSEKEIFKEKYLQHPKNFVVIASYLDRKSVSDCVQYYYTSKKTENYKRLLRKSRHRTRASRNNTQKGISNASTSVVDILTTGVTTRLQREQQQKTGRELSNQLNNQTTATSTPTTTSEPSNSNSPTNTTPSLATTVPDTPTSNTTPPIPSTATTTTCTNSTTTIVTSNAAPPTVITASSSTPTPCSPNAAAAAIQCSTPLSTLTTSCVTTVTTPVVVGGAPSIGANANESDSGASTVFNSEVKDGNRAQTPLSNSGEGKVKLESGNGVVDAVKNAIGVDGVVKMDVDVTTEGASDNSTTLIENKKKKERRKDKENSAMETSDEENPEILDKQSQPGNNGVCLVCSTQLGPQSRSLTPSQAPLYGLREEQVPPNGRICNTCRCKIVRSRITTCPLPHCPNQRGGRMKRLRSLPLQRLAEAPEHILAELHVPAGVTKSCSACYNRIVRRLGPLEEWPEDEIEKLRGALTELGANWQLVGERLSKTAQQVRGFYAANKKRFNLDSCLGDRKPTLTDEEESGSSTSSCEEPIRTEQRHHSAGGSDTASAAENSPVLLQDPSGHPHQLHNVKKEDYDSSATETADEAQTPDHYQGSATITPVTQDGQPKGNASLSVKDLVLNVIEFSLKKTPGSQQAQNPPVSGMAPTISSILNNDPNEVTIVSEYNLNSQPRPQREDINIAKLVTPLIGATITPVTGPILPQNQEQIPAGRDDLVVLQVPDTGREPETLDLSIKKPREFQQQQQQQHKMGQQQQQQQLHPRQQQEYMYHQERKSPFSGRAPPSKLPSPKLANPNPKAGSITLGTPIISQPRYDALLRQTDAKMGSITQGTPIHMPHLSDKQRANSVPYDIYKKMSLSTQNHPPPPSSYTTTPAPTSGHYRQPYDQQMSSRQIIMNDYITSQQMLGRRNEKTQYYTAAASPVRRTPPPPAPTQAPSGQGRNQQRQGVIQRHTRPPYLPPGHEAFSSLVDVASQQPSLPVPSAPHEGLGKTMVDNIMEQPHRYQMIQHQQQQLRQQQQHQAQQRIEEQHRRASSYHALQQQQAAAAQQQQGGGRQGQAGQQRGGDSSTLTAASLIDAIITHQINQTAEGGREVVNSSNEPTRPGDLLFQSFPAPTSSVDNPHQASGNVINVDIDPPDGVVSKNLTVKELTDSVISHDFSAAHVAPPSITAYYNISDMRAEQWKRRVQQLQQHQQSEEQGKRGGGQQQQQQQQQQQRGEPPQREDERQIIRIAQPQNKYHVVEPVSPPENNHWSESNYRRYQQPQSHISALDYVKNRIVEVMRTEDDKKDSQQQQHEAHNSTNASSGGANTNQDKDLRSDSPGDMVIDEDKHENEYQQQQSAGQPQVSQHSTFSYPYVHKEVTMNDRNNEPKPLLSAQYEPLSDED